MKRTMAAMAALAWWGTNGDAAAQAPAPTPAVSAPISDVRYVVTFDRETAAQRSLRVETSFRTESASPVLLSLPAWTPGAYEIDNFARKVTGFSARTGLDAVRWDKLDFDTWRVVPPEGGGTVTVTFTYRADSLDNAMAWSTDDFLMVNGTNVFFYPEGLPFEFPARVSVRTEPEWSVATGMRRATTGGYREADYHDLVDMPLFVGAFDLDSTRVRGQWFRLASYPQGAFRADARGVLWNQIVAMMPPMQAVFGETPFETYTTLLIFEEDYPGGSALEHQNSHVGIYQPAFIGSGTLASITAHEIFHAWNVKRLRPAAMVPYDYGRPQPTTLLWVSEGITDYYADLALVRGGIAAAPGFYRVTERKVERVVTAPPNALEDLSLSAWIAPIDDPGAIYYPKGSLVGLLLDVLIRDATANAASLDDVMRELYRATYQQGRGFTTEEWWETVERVAGRDFDEFAARYVDGRDPLPLRETLALAGLEFRADTVRVPWLGTATTADSLGIVVRGVTAGGAAERAGVREGDYLVRIGEVEVEDAGFGEAFRKRYDRSEEGTGFQIVVRRGDETVTLEALLAFNELVSYRIEEATRPSPEAAAVLRGILTGETGGSER